MRVDKSQQRKEYHYGFYAFMKSYYGMSKATITYEQEKQLGEEPIRLDFLLLRNNLDETLDDPIGQFLKKDNIMEYKSPDDSLTIDDFYKVQGYGLIYKGYDHKIDELPINDMTVTIVRHRYPRKMIRTLKRDGIQIRKDQPGIYRMSGRLSISTQLIVISQLSSGLYNGLKLLSKDATIEEMDAYVKEIASSDNDSVKDYASTVIRLCLTINNRLQKELEERDYMINNVYEEVLIKEGNMMKSKARKEGLKEGKTEGKDEEKGKIATAMLKDHESTAKIIKWTGLTLDQIKHIAKKIGIAHLVL